MMEEMSFQVSGCQGFSILDGGGKFIPPVRNGTEIGKYADEYSKECSGVASQPGPICKKIVRAPPPNDLGSNSFNVLIL